ncbi:MAG TPA: DUF2164 family protein [Rubricoccaceae bacterium]|jgi:uncharacterized protein (DUF2164 family)
MPVSLPAPGRSLAIEAIQVFFRDERDERIGDLQAGFLLDAVLAAAGPAVFNAGVQAAQAHLLSVVGDLDSVVFEPEAAAPPRSGR